VLDARYVVTVTRTALYQGELTIADDSQIIHRQIVGLMFGAVFGADVDDVYSWKQIAIEFIERLASGESTL
jgi:hypothetical protein